MVVLPVEVFLVLTVGFTMFAAIIGLLVGGACRVAGEADEREIRMLAALMTPREEE